MARKGSGFEDKFLSKIGKIDPRRIREFLLQLLSRKNFFETVFDHLTEAIIVTDDRMRVIYVNRQGRELLRWRENQEVFGEDLAGRCPPGGLRETLEAMRRKPRAISGYHCSLGRDSGPQLLLTAIPVRSQGRAAAGEAEGPLGGAMWVFILSDDTERQQHLEAQARAQRLGSLALLTSGVAHEIKNPLNSINLHAQILAQMADADDTEPLEKARVERVARVILEESQRLEDIVNEFIQAARPQRAMMQPRYLNHIIEDLARLFETECAQHDIDLEVDLDPELPPAPLDANLMFQALRNLVRNALDAHVEDDEAAGEESGPRPARFIRIRTRIAGDAIALEIADNGPGIGEQAIDKIFDPYYTTKSRGTGLGLMVVNRIIAEHHGQIRVESRRGVGTRFLITLPLDERPVRLLPGPDPAAPEES